ncbi:MAG: HlyD family efflux transporter periplasmic adaptor subunit [Candidatus Falkowbacteria bacterium]
MKKKKIFIILGVLILAGSSYFVFFNKKPGFEYTTVAAKRGDLIQSVSEVGSVKASKELNLNFNQMGSLARILVKNGDVVKKDQLLAELDYSSLLIREREAQSNVDIAQATLNKLLSGATPSDIAVVTSQVNQAKAAYAAATSNFSKTQNSINESVRQLQSNVDDLNSQGNIYYAAWSNAQDNLSTSLDAKNSTANNALDFVDYILSNKDIEKVLSAENLTYLADAKKYYYQATALKAPADTALLLAHSNLGPIDFSNSVTASLNYLNLTFKALNSTFGALENSVVGVALTQTQLDTFKNTANTNLTTVSAGIAAVQAAYAASNNAKINLDQAQKNAANALSSANVNGAQQLATSQSQVDATRQALDVAQKQLDKIKTPARSEDISLARGQLDSARANFDLIKKQVTDNQIIAPMDGQISQINYEIGEQVSAAKPAITMLTEKNFEVDVDIPESDISKVKVGDAVSMTFDAFGENRKFAASVVFIDPAATSIQNVIYYNVKVMFNDSESLADIKAGMTANVVITTNSRQGIMIIPNRAIVDKAGQGRFVRILTDVKNNTISEIPVTIGLNGNDGLVELLSGDIKEGDLVVTYVKDLSK